MTFFLFTSDRNVTLELLSSMGQFILNIRKVLEFPIQNFYRIVHNAKVLHWTFQLWTLFVSNVPKACFKLIAQLFIFSCNYYGWGCLSFGVFCYFGWVFCCAVVLLCFLLYSFVSDLVFWVSIVPDLYFGNL